MRLRSTKFSLFSAISLAAIVFLIVLAGSICYNLSFIDSVAFRPKIHTNVLFAYKIFGQLTSKSSSQPLHWIKEEMEEATNKGQMPLLPPLNVKEEKGFERLTKAQPVFQMLKSNGLSKKFAAGAHKFFSSGCEVQFFMTWISPAENFSQRERFVLDSLFKAHPHGCSLDTPYGKQIVKPLCDRGFRVLAVTPNLPFLLENTAAQAWLEEMMKGNKDPSTIPLAQNLSNLLRLAVLYKYGGVYMDADFVVLKKLSGLRNTVGAQSMDKSGNRTRLNNAVLIFDKSHPLLLEFIQEFANTFNGNKWGQNGPYQVSRVADRVASRPGFNFTVLPPMVFYLVHWEQIAGFFKCLGTLAKIQKKRSSWLLSWRKETRRFQF